jgi:hypothetical protein
MQNKKLFYVYAEIWTHISMTNNVTSQLCHTIALSTNYTLANFKLVLQWTGKKCVLIKAQEVLVAVFLGVIKLSGGVPFYWFSLHHNYPHFLQGLDKHLKQMCTIQHLHFFQRINPSLNGCNQLPKNVKLNCHSQKHSLTENKARNKLCLFHLPSIKPFLTWVFTNSVILSSKL